MSGNRANARGLMVTFARPRVLVVDDDPVFRRAMARLLRDLPIEIELAHSGAAALAAFDEAAVALVLSDVEMYPMDGCELVAELRRRRVDVPVVFVSGCDRDVIAQRLRQLGLPTSPDVISKPINRLELFELVQRHLALAPSPSPSPPAVRDGL